MTFKHWWCRWLETHLHVHSTVDARIVECLPRAGQARENMLRTLSLSPPRTTGASPCALPLPRLELRWTQEDDPEHWLCRYRLVFPCADLREATEQGWTLVELVELGATRCTRTQEPIDPHGTVDTPWRDGAHCRRYAAVLHIPAYAVYGEHVTRLEPDSLTSP